MPRRAALAVAASLVLSACGAPRGTQTLGHEPDLARIAIGSTLPGLRREIAHDVERLRHACAQIDATVRSQLTATVGGPDIDPLRWSLEDARCQWASSPTGAPRVVVGIVDGGTYRFSETAKLLKD